MQGVDYMNRNLLQQLNSNNVMLDNETLVVDSQFRLIYDYDKELHG